MMFSSPTPSRKISNKSYLDNTNVRPLCYSGAEVDILASADVGAELERKGMMTAYKIQKDCEMPAIVTFENPENFLVRLALRAHLAGEALILERHLREHLIRLDDRRRELLNLLRSRASAGGDLTLARSFGRSELGLELRHA